MNKRSRLKNVLKWSGIGCGGFVVLFIVLIIIASICGTPDDGEISQPNAANDSGTDSTLKPTLVPSPTEKRTVPTATPIPTPRPTPTSTPTATPTPAPIQIQLSDLLKEYDQNKVLANTRLRYRENGELPVSTSGYVSDIEQLYVTLTAVQEQYSFQELHCYYADTRTALEITKGQLVSVMGKVRGTDGFSDDVYMYSCKIDGVNFEQNPKVSAQKLSNNVVQVFCTPGSFFSTGQKGTGVILDKDTGIVLTVHHVVADENDCKEVEVELPGVEARLSAQIVRHCASIDRARLRVSIASLTGLSLQSIYRATAPAQNDQKVYFWGYGPGELRMENGIVVDVFGEDIITDAYAVPGDSGSPVFDENGHLLGTMSRGNRSDRAVFTGDEC